MATVPASDIDRARSFYADSLGMKPKRENPDGGLYYEVAGTELLVYPSAYAGTNQATAVAIRVDDIAATVGELRGRNIEFHEYEFDGMATRDGIMDLPDGSRGAWFTDSEGNIVGLFQEIDA